ncbi:MAG: putative DNA-3-methyladenine glycosylase [Candidatus Woesebacteria bacterium GW2011_GWB1_38_5b]|uniref:DNA-3-methyladenine glycosylase II n=1 Tax=Candidatus Woesebacteria bacterium GW2011_GWB1_38_5b TaxID=1618569 RepID=A0A0G0MPE8_9BACT|nr:MAG: putative DNA-3-methyladenine glycosylase [Candidatus Woesebacteria bacterium GW2011_GWB1_38_5b]
MVNITGLVKPEDPFIDLVETIINQQLSDKAAATIFGRFKKLFPEEKITAEKLLKIPDEKIREAGISYSKIKYIKGIAQQIKNKKLNLKNLENLSDEDVINELVKLKGIGAWTAEMYLMFTLARPDVFSAGDLGLQNAIVKLYKIKQKPTRERLLEISIKWSPYRTTASRILWRSLDLK